MGGTRYNARGIDEEGNVSNHTEVEQICYIMQKHDPPMTFKNSMNEISSVTKTARLYSFVQVRGSMPFFWTQQGLLDVKIQGSIDRSLRPFSAHFESLHKDYSGGQIMCMNLVAPGKKLELPLLKMYEDLLQTAKLPKSSVNYKHFDFHVECKDNSDPYYQLIDKFLMPNHLRRAGIYCKTFRLITEEFLGQKQTKVQQYVEQRQKGVVRTNCIDCLDRTNVAQQITC